MTDDFEQRLDRLESIVAEQQEIIETQRERIDDQQEVIEALKDAQVDPEHPVSRRSALKAGGLLTALGLGAGATAGTASADPQGQVGTASDPLTDLYTTRLTLADSPYDGTGDETVTSLTGDRLSITSGTLTADVTGVSSDRTSVYANADEINFGPGLYVQDDLNGTVTVTTSAPPFSVAFADTSDDTPRRLNVDGTVEDYATSVSATTLGPPTVDLTGDGTLDLPVRDGNGDLTIVDVDGNAQTLANSIELSGIGVGDWNGDGTVEVVYVRDDGGVISDNNLYSVAPGRSPTNLGFEPRTDIAVADFDGDGSQEIIWGNDDGSNINLVYSSDGGSTTDTGYDVEVELSTPADFDGDGAIEIAASTSSDDIELVEDDGTVTTLSTSYTVSTESMGALDYTGTGVPDVIHSRGNSPPSDIYYYDVVNDATGPVTDASGTTLQLTSAGVR